MILLALALTVFLLALVARLMVHIVVRVILVVALIAAFLFFGAFSRFSMAFRRLDAGIPLRPAAVTLFVER